MNKGKAVFVTALMAVMLVLIGIELFVISVPYFITLAGALALYGYLRGASDFLHWLSKADHEAAAKAAKLPAKAPQERKVFDWQQEEARLRESNAGKNRQSANTPTADKA